MHELDIASEFSDFFALPSPPRSRRQGVRSCLFKTVKMALYRDHQKRFAQEPETLVIS